jgi:hypothetical protein
MTTKTRKPFTNVTWDSLSSGLHAGSDLGWMAQTDLAHELAAKSVWVTLEQALTLVELTAAGLPIRLTWKTRVSGRLEKTTATVLVSYLHAPTRDGESMPGYMHIRYTGFGHTVYLSQVVDIQVPETERTFEDLPQI